MNITVTVDVCVLHAIVRTAYDAIPSILSAGSIGAQIFTDSVSEFACFIVVIIRRKLGSTISKHNPMLLSNDFVKARGRVVSGKFSLQLLNI